jgi:hypothetical protein
MMTLSAKAQLFIQAALKATKTAPLVAEAEALGPDPWSQPLTAKATKIAVEALKEMEMNIRDRLGNPEVDDNEHADLVNDLGYAAAVRYDLEQNIKIESQAVP